MITTLIALATALSATKTELTVYNQGFALVKEVRSLNLKEGRQTVGIEDVASMIDPTSVSMRSLSDPLGLHILEQNYQFDLISSASILNKSVGQRVRFLRTVGNVRDELQGTLISAPTAIVGSSSGGSQQTYNGMVIRTDDGRIVLDPTGEVEVQSVPAGLISKPTLFWDLEADSKGENSVELSYITQGIKWSTDYVLTLDGTDNADLQGWVTIDNQSGATFEQANLKLLAGDVHTVEVAPRVTRMMAKVTDSLAGRSPFNEESLFEYHLYTLQRPATVRNREIKQLSLLEGKNLPVHKRLIVDAMQDYGNYYPSEGEVGSGPIKPQVRIEFENKSENGLGIPLPEGKFRIYQRDSAGSVQLLGEDRISHTPVDEKVSLVVGKSFDVVAERKRLSFHRLGPQSFEETFEIEVRNHKNAAEKVEVIERHYGDWKVTQTSQKFTKLDANAMSYDLSLAPNESKKINYTIQTRWNNTGD